MKLNEVGFQIALGFEDYEIIPPHFGKFVVQYKHKENGNERE